MIKIIVIYFDIPSVHRFSQHICVRRSRDALKKFYIFSNNFRILDSPTDLSAFLSINSTLCMFAGPHLKLNLYD